MVLFSLPGAFTSTCSAAHLPRFQQLASLFRKHGIDDIVCLSGNDSFVMNAWAKDLKADQIQMVPDGNLEVRPS